MKPVTLTENVEEEFPETLAFKDDEIPIEDVDFLDYPDIRAEL